MPNSPKGNRNTRKLERKECSVKACPQKADYVGKIELIEKEFGTCPIAALTDRRTRGVSCERRDKLEIIAPTG